MVLEAHLLANYYSLSNEAGFCQITCVCAIVCVCMNYSPHVWCNQRMFAELGSSLGIGQMSGRFSINGQDEVTNPEPSVSTDGAAVNDAANQHARSILQCAHSHTCNIHTNDRQSSLTDCKHLHSEL